MKKWNDSPKIQELLSRMTLQEKIGQLNQRNICAYDEHVEEIKQEVREGKIGSLLFSGSAIPENGGMEAFDLDFTRELQEAAMESRLKIPLLLGRDVIHGFETIFPIPLMMAASFDDRLIRHGCQTSWITWPIPSTLENRMIRLGCQTTVSMTLSNSCSTPR